MKVLLVEDEQVAARTLQRLLLACAPDAEVVAVLPTVRKTVEFLQQPPALDLIFMDIHLSDGSAMQIFEQVLPQVPVVFTTAYDAYAVKAFELNSLDYLLKPISQERLKQTLERFQQQRQANAAEPMLSKLEAVLHQLKPQPEQPYKTRFLVKAGSKLLPVETHQIAYFYRDDEVVQLVTPDGKRHPVNYALDELEQMLNPGTFFRLNRQFVVNLSALAEIHSYFKGKLKIDLSPPAPVDVVVSQEKASEFKAWLEGDRAS
ncbi:MAG: LytR/AlgR family response regulator transcription factor [Rufibacter sp.]